MSSKQHLILNKEDRKRLREIFAVLKKHTIQKGLSPVKIRKIFEDLGPTFVKVGQLLSMRPELIPQEYCDELVNLRTDVAPMDQEEVFHIVEQELRKPFDQVFLSFDPVPIGSASIAQVHRAKLTDGTEVAVKVQRPDIYRTMERDILLMRRLDSLVRMSDAGKVIDLNTILDELWSSARQEMDFLIEASNLEEFARNNKDIKYVCCPSCYRSLSTSRLLVMDFSDGVEIDDVEMLTQRGYDLNEIGRKLVSNYIKQVIEDRFFQADPHPGNIFISGGKIVWLDMGMMGRITEFDAHCYKAALNAVIEHDYETVKDVIIRMGVCTEQVDEIRMVEDIRQFIGHYEDMALADINLGTIMNEALRLAASYKIKMPAGITMVSRGIATLEGLLEIISPDVSVIRIIAAGHSMSLLDDVDLKKESLVLMRNLLYSGKDLTRLPSQLSRMADRIEQGKVQVKIEPVHLEKPVRSFSSSLRRLTIGLVAAACIISSAIFFQKGTDLSTVISFLILALGLLLAVFAIITKDKDKTGQK